MPDRHIENLDDARESTTHAYDMTLLTANDLLATREWLQAVHSTLGSYDMSSLSVDVALGVMERAVKSVTDSQKVLRELALVLGQMETGR